MSKFLIGNCVEIVVEPVGGNENIKAGDTGTVVDISDGYIGVEFDRDISGHDCGGAGEKGCCHYFDERTELDCLKLTNKELNDKLYDKMIEEQKLYEERLKALPPEEILKNAYEYALREDIICLLDNFDYTDDQALELLEHEDVLSMLCNAYDSADDDYMLRIWTIVQEAAESLVVKKNGVDGFKTGDEVIVKYPERNGFYTNDIKGGDKGVVIEPYLNSALLVKFRSGKSRIVSTKYVEHERGADYGENE